MVFNRHLKALNLCNHSDTIACVLYELLVNLELIIVGFQTHVQGSTSFSFVQFSRSCCAVLTGCPAGHLDYDTTADTVCQQVFKTFSSFFRILLRNNLITTFLLRWKYLIILKRVCQGICNTFGKMHKAEGVETCRLTREFKNRRIDRRADASIGPYRTASYISSSCILIHASILRSRREIWTWVLPRILAVSV